MGRRVLLIANREKPDAVAALPEVRALVAGAGGSVVGELDAGPEPPRVPEATDLIIVLGGDGSILSQSRRLAHLGLPMLGVNLGKVGFIAEFDLPDLRRQAGSLLGGRALPVFDRPMLRARVLEPGAATPRFEGTALNDCVITAGPPFRMIWLTLSIDGRPGPTVVGDGLIVSTPLGSTAYNVSAGGPIVSPDVPALSITPIAAHSLSFRPVLVGLESSATVTLERVNREEEAEPARCAGTTLVLDGQVLAPLRRGDR
ncbi:MAG TPA: NAD(+)/NADH kinase, partial [Phycisphaerales bacterium]|nr:NAD(+)/NADH kinase [Phycisphaerales bacterium]